MLFRSFDYFKKSLGLDEEDCIECIIKSPFNYDEQMSVYIPTDIQDSENINAFVTDASKFILNILLKTGGKAFILFTSYTMLNQIYYSISKKLKDKGFEVFDRLAVHPIGVGEGEAVHVVLLLEVGPSIYP